MYLHQQKHPYIQVQTDNIQRIPYNFSFPFFSWNEDICSIIVIYLSLLLLGNRFSSFNIRAKLLHTLASSNALVCQNFQWSPTRDSAESFTFLLVIFTIWSSLQQLCQLECYNLFLHLQAYGKHGWFGGFFGDFYYWLFSFSGFKPCFSLLWIFLSS